MEITIEFLEKIPGKPDWLGEWQLRRFKDVTGEWTAVFEVEGSSKDVLLAATIWVDEGNRVFVRSEVQTSRSNLELAIYARRVEIEIGRVKQERMYFVDGYPMASRRDAIDNVFDDADLRNDGPTVEVEIDCGTPFYAESAIDANALLTTIEARIREEAGTGECGGPEFEWKRGAEDGLRAFVREYADLKQWYHIDCTETVKLKVVRGDDGEVDGWEEITESEVANAGAG